MLVEILQRRPLPSPPNTARDLREQILPFKVTGDGPLIRAIRLKVSGGNAACVNTNPSPPRQDDVEILPVDFHGKALHLSPPVGEAFPCPYLELPAVHGARDDVRLIARVMLAHPAVILNVSRDLAEEVPRADGALLVGTFIFEREKPVAQPEYPELKALQFEANPLAGAYLGRPRRPEPPRHLCAHL